MNQPFGKPFGLANTLRKVCQGQQKGVATYTTTAEMQEKLRKALPDVEALKKLL